MPFIASSDASVAPDGPLPMMPTVSIAVLISRNWFYGPVTKAGLSDRFVRSVNIKFRNPADKAHWLNGGAPG